jgi:serine/threonine protein kinase
MHACVHLTPSHSISLWQTLIQHFQTVQVVRNLGSIAVIGGYMMEIVHGKNLEEHVEHNGRLPIAESLHIMRQIAQTVSSLHSLLMIHGSLSPRNVLLKFEQKDVLRKGLSGGSVRDVRDVGGKRGVSILEATPKLIGFGASRMTNHHPLEQFVPEFKKTATFGAKSDVFWYEISNHNPTICAHPSRL